MSLYDYQQRVKTAVQNGKSIILQAPTGAGKTRASLAPFIEAFFDFPVEAFPKKCVYAVPMRVLANQFEAEYSNLSESYQRKFRRKIEVGVQTGERPKDTEFSADVTFATIDQVLSSWLMHPYSLSRRRGNLNAGAFVGSYLIFDEFHLFDPDSTLPTTLHMLKTLKGISPFVLMTATFSADMLHELANLLDAEPFLLTEDDLQGIGSQEKTRRFHTQEAPLVVEGNPRPTFVLQRHRQQQGRRRSIVIFNQVERAQHFYQAVQAQAPAGTEIRLLHSRFQKEDRQQIENEIRREFGKNPSAYRHESMILIATQVIEVGLDATCQALHTELAPAASVLQRAGRCARYQGEEGDVYLYPVESEAPYHGTEAKAQSQRTWEWLCENQNRHLTFADEQTLINHAHGPTDRKLLNQLDAGSFDHREQIRTLWRGEGDRGEAKRLIHNIQSQSLLVHSDPNQLLHAPFAADTFSIHPGTLQGKFEQWQEKAEEDWKRDALPWAVCRLSEVDADEEANRPIEYVWVPVQNKHEMWGAPLLVVHPELVGYRQDLGLTLYRGDPYQCEVPEKKEARSWQTFYRLESYYDHIRLVHEAFTETEDRFRAAAHRLEAALGWRQGLVTEMAHLVVWLHDVGKLGVGWQAWAQDWQTAVGRPHENGALAHTDYDSDNAQHRQLNKKMGGKRPPHAVESALAAIPFLLQPVENKMDHPLFRAAFTAIARHHAPFSRHSDGYQLVERSVQELAETAALLPAALQELGSRVPDSDAFEQQLNVEQRLRGGGRFIQEKLLVNERRPADVCAYMLLVRALRHADQEGTKRGAKR